jgi:two-component system response regulator PilR (NtrC family)
VLPADRPLRVLVVDDEPSFCQVLSLVLGSYGMQVATALSVVDANQALDKSTFDVLLVDLRLRDGRGDALFRSAIERDPLLRDHTLFMTGDISPEAERAIADTNCPYLRKPFDIAVAVEAVAALASGRG